MIAELLHIQPRSIRRRGCRMRRLCPGLLGLVATLVCPTVEAQTLELEVTTYQSRLRTQAPIPLEMNLSWDGFKILEGWLELSFNNQQLMPQGQLKPIAHYRSPELALSTGDRRFRMLLPPQRITNSLGLLGIQARFVTADGNQVLDLGTHEISMPRNSQRRLRVGVVLAESQIAIAEEQLQFVRELALEQFRTQAAIEKDKQPGPLITQSVRVQSRDLPRSSIEFCVYDMVVITRDSLAELRPTSMDALIEWVRAGGSALIDMGGSFEDRQAEFLNQLLAGRTQDPFVSLSRDGRATLTDPTNGQPASDVMRNFGLGRVAVTTRELSMDFNFEDQDWRSMVTWLWKMNHGQSVRVTHRPGTWFESPPPFDPRRDFLDPPGAFQPSGFTGEQALTQMLLPDRVQSIPPWHVISMLVVFLLLIAPGDYVVLGLIRRRTLTWVLFPAVSLAVTFYTVRLAQSTIGSTDYRTSLTIVDMVDDTTIARSTQVELLFTASERDASVDERDVMFTPLVETDIEARTGPVVPAYRNRSQRRANEDSFQMGVEHEPPRYEGQVPRSYRVVRRMRKWTPQLSRRTWFGPPPEPVPAFDWSRITPELLHNATNHTLGETTGMEADSNAPGITVIHSKARIARSGETPGSPVFPLGSFEAFVKSVSSPSPVGWPAVVTRMSPTGAANLEDLRLLDHSDPNACLVIVMIRQGDNAFAFRRLYQLKPLTMPAGIQNE